MIFLRFNNEVKTRGFIYIYLFLISEKAFIDWFLFLKNLS